MEFCVPKPLYELGFLYTFLYCPVKLSRTKLVRYNVFVVDSQVSGGVQVPFSHQFIFFFPRHHKDDGNVTRKVIYSLVFISELTLLVLLVCHLLTVMLTVQLPEFLRIPFYEVELLVYSHSIFLLLQK